MPLVSDYYWMSEFDAASINGERWPVSVSSLIFDSGSSVNHIPTKEYNILLTAITKDHNCRVELNEHNTYYWCECVGADDPTYPTLSIHSGDTTFNFKPRDYLVFESIDAISDPLCMITFQKETKSNYNFWLLGDSFLRAFYTIYDGEGKRIGLVGDTEVRIVEKDGMDSDMWNNPEIFFLIGALAILCIVAFSLSIAFSVRLRKRN